MSFENGNGGNGGNMYMVPMAPNSYGNNGGFGGLNGDALWWVIVLFMFMANGNWNGNNGGYMYPPMMYNVGSGTDASMQRGFDQSAIMAGLNGIQQSVTTGFSGVNQGICTGLAGVNQNMTNGFFNAETANNGRQMANMQQAFGMQQAMNNGFNTLGNTFSTCCCDQKAAIADLKYTVATEACADRNAISSALRDVLEATNATGQRIIDQMCQDKIDAKNDEIARLRQQVMMSTLAESQNAQTAVIQAGQRNLANEVEQYVLPTPRPCWLVQNPNCCAG